MPHSLSKRPSPLSIRLSAEERAQLESQAGPLALSVFIKDRLFGVGGKFAQASDRASADRTLLAHLLATLGASNIAPNLDRIAYHAENGDLVFDDDTVRELRQACDDVRLMHNALMRGMGLKEAKPSRRQLEAIEAFNRAARKGQQ